MRSFDNPDRRTTGPEFEIRGQQFTCRSGIPWSVLEEMAAGGVASITRLFAAALSEDDYTRFRVLLDDPADPIRPGEINTLVESLVEEFTEVPTRPSSRLPAGARTAPTAPPSSDGSLREAVEMADPVVVTRINASWAQVDAAS